MFNLEQLLNKYPTKFDLNKFPGIFKNRFVWENVSINSIEKPKHIEKSCRHSYGYVVGDELVEVVNYMDTFTVSITSPPVAEGMEPNVSMFFENGDIIST